MIIHEFLKNIKELDESAGIKPLSIKGEGLEASSYNLTWLISDIHDNLKDTIPLLSPTGKYPYKNGDNTDDCDITGLHTHSWRNLHLLYRTEQLCLRYSQLQEERAKFKSSESLDDIIKLRHIQIVPYDELYPTLFNLDNYYHTVYKNVMLPLVSKQECQDIMGIYSAIDNCEDSLERLFQEIRHTIKEELQRLQDDVKAKVTDKDRVIRTVNRRIDDAMQVIRVPFLYNVNIKLKSGKYTLTDRLKIAYQRLSNNSVHTSMQYFGNTGNPRGNAESLFQALNLNFGVDSYFADNDILLSEHDFYQYFATIIEIALLENIEGKPVPERFFQCEEKIADNSQQTTAKQTTAKRGRRSKTLADFIRSTQEDREDTMNRFIQELKRIPTDKAKVKFISQQIGKTLTDWPTYNSLKEYLKGNSSNWCTVTGEFKAVRSRSQKQRK